MPFDGKATPYYMEGKMTKLNLIMCSYTKRVSHLGRDKTWGKVLLWTDVKEYIRTCEICQRTNDDKFHKASSSLHPIPVVKNNNYYGTAVFFSSTYCNDDAMDRKMRA